MCTFKKRAHRGGIDFTNERAMAFRLELSGVTLDRIKDSIQNL